MPMLATLTIFVMVANTITMAQSTDTAIINTVLRTVRIAMGTQNVQKKQAHTESASKKGQPVATVDDGQGEGSRGPCRYALAVQRRR